MQIGPIKFLQNPQDEILALRLVLAVAVVSTVACAILAFISLPTHPFHAGAYALGTLSSIGIIIIVTKRLQKLQQAKCSAGIGDARDRPSPTPIVEMELLPKQPVKTPQRTDTSRAQALLPEGTPACVNRREPLPTSNFWSDTWKLLNTLTGKR